MATKGRAVKSAGVFTAIKSIKKHEKESLNGSQIPAINTAVSPSNQIDSRLVSAASIDYINDTLQVTVQNICKASSAIFS